VQQLNVTGRSEAPFTQRSAIGKLNCVGAFVIWIMFSLAIETVSKLTYIKHNLILEHPDLFKIKRRQEAEPSNEDILNEIAADDIVIEDC
jgi:hypothetical protein